MKKLNYFFAALLVGGAALSLSSCIDTTEPAGIVAMRTSTSEYMKAKAGYENALAQLKLVEVEKEKVAVEAAKIALELDKIAVCIIQRLSFRYIKVLPLRCLSACTSTLFN